MSILERFGVDESSLGDQFAGCIIGRTLILDGDGAAYRAAAKAKKLDTVVRRFKTSVYEAMYLTRAEYARVHLTPKGCYKNGRHLLLGAKPYQANRGSSPKPPLLEPLRGIADSVFDVSDNVIVFPHYQLEADDGIMQDSYSIENAVVWSEDKDLNIVPSPRYDVFTGNILALPAGDRFGWIGWRYTPSGAAEPTGHGTKFFWLQMLMGDTADNVSGLLRYDGKACGKVTAMGLLEPIKSEDHAANLVINGYRESGQNPLPEAEAMWLTRSHGDTATGYIWSLDLTERNRHFILECFNTKYKLTDEEYLELCADHSTTT